MFLAVAVGPALRTRYFPIIEGVCRNYFPTIYRIGGYGLVYPHLKHDHNVGNLVGLARLISTKLLFLSGKTALLSTSVKLLAICDFEPNCWHFQGIPVAACHSYMQCILSTE